MLLLKVKSGSRLINRLRTHQFICVILLCYYLVIPYATAYDPYEILGVRRDASLDQIKQAYRDLAKKHHPDKSNLNENEKFIEISKAFNLLKDTSKRSRFDHYGETEENRRSRAQGNRYGHAREYWDHRGHRTYTFFSSSNSQLKQKSVSARLYYNEYLKQSKTKLFFVFFYSDFCPSCSLIESSWIKITDELANYNIGSFTINVYQESRLAQELGINSIPHIACLLDGQLKSYYQSQLSLANIVKFTKSILPENLVSPLPSEVDQDRFIALGPQRNRLSAIIINSESNLRLRYLVLAYELRSFYKFGHVSTKNSEYFTLAKKYNLSLESNPRETQLLTFNENILKPIVHLTLSSDSFDLVQLRQQLIEWPFLQLPKLFSQQRFDELCLFSIPKNGENTEVKLCVILFATDTPSSSLARKKMIEFIQLNNLEADKKVVFSYIDPSKQSSFISSLLDETQDTYPFDLKESIDLAIILVERSKHGRFKARYMWLNSRWDPKKLDVLDRAKLELYRVISEYKGGISTEGISFKKVALEMLVDEEGPTLIYRIFWRFIDYNSRFLHFITSRESFSSVIVLTMCALIASLFLYQSPVNSPNQNQPPFMPGEFDYQQTKMNNSSNNSQPCRSAEQVDQDELKILELKAETYNGMIRLLKPGYRSIVLLTTRDTRDKLIEDFKKAVWPYRRNKTLLFGYLCLDKNLDWYKSLLQEAFGISDLETNVNKRNCTGTVLSLNGFKKYFRVYHAKHNEKHYNDNDDETEAEGSFLGFNERALDDVESAKLKLDENLANSSLSVDNLLVGLPIWLDKMFDGLTKRYFLDSWPENMK